MKYQTRAYDAGLRQRMKAIARERRATNACLFCSSGRLRGAPPWRPQPGHFGNRAQKLVPTAPNDRWLLDFVPDQLTDCRRFRFLIIVDDCSRESLALVADTSLSSTWRELDRLMIERGKPRTLRGLTPYEFFCRA